MPTLPGCRLPSSPSVRSAYRWGGGDIVPVCPAGPPTFAFAFFCLVHRSSGCVSLPAVALSVSVGESERGRTPFRLRLRPSFLAAARAAASLLPCAPVHTTYIYFMALPPLLSPFVRRRRRSFSIRCPLPALSVSLSPSTCVRVYPDVRRPTYPIPVFPSLHAFHPRACSLFAALFAGSLPMILPNQ